MNETAEEIIRDMLIYMGNLDGSFCEHCKHDPRNCSNDGVCFQMSRAGAGFSGRIRRVGKAEGGCETQSLPDGVAWPCYEDGSPVSFGDRLHDDNGGGDFGVSVFNFTPNGVLLGNRKKKAQLIKYGEPVVPSTGERVASS